MFSKKTAIITGASRGIGRMIALSLSKKGANVVIAAKTKEKHETLEGSILSVAKEIEDLGGQALPYQLDVRDAESIEQMAIDVKNHFGSIDILINNAGAIYLTDTLTTSAKQYDLMNDINARATFLTSKAVIPHMQGNGGHILNLSPPLNFDQKFLTPHIAYTISKFGMSMCTIGMAQEFKEYNISINSLWPKYIIYTAAVKRLLGIDSEKNCRKPEIMADAALWILSQAPRSLTGQLLLDEEVLKKAQINDLSTYACINNGELLPDLYVSY